MFHITCRDQDWPAGTEREAADINSTKDIVSIAAAGDDKVGRPGHNAEEPGRTADGLCPFACNGNRHHSFEHCTQFGEPLFDLSSLDLHDLTFVDHPFACRDQRWDLGCRQANKMRSKSFGKFDPNLNNGRRSLIDGEVYDN
ncbi:hypothetical protein X755_30750 [Mesorhizobium sp. LNJC405B00]|nr:hypothetical protein X755_30750 [Mesorhizobium sp. LNJC405B00]